ncbi:F0F1 ATP synthase subunit B [Cytophaga hutchinsonii]|jgi:F-type H+-transporting ATPase subunit b|uniref:ATP synthase subunit b n=1 Tax=Cytophaga hutchinsonii (strain ATCC 33406 / DSM 1761 / CIP 103989 / NBRC 15051 / NCIMB 9469 / D465) TaxID=269798 RepID=ATPF_CYTH3|nr:F0F1 ATP synthase subunit B [Cytophaga hutchinsonii]Q11YP3.1 RecName: Full=ATP synthase subunit b; AltName: Full=ATP synthase F(0) sector subunit b; AltName: Full=ATPase subunit I; AltName: Full=F-type ATPase subunit b; Short=F-ATPase subunit b [Cytophaga hutchinsonii ATCC 33406]ABG57473.1 ATP synthase F0 subcomplex B subunit [Cytophaga hutchinsonii ATCC 33406]SFW98247.1 ATP synthase F0 subcomplex B subunit [Cytophaga hutchinsonii ATCC 33406]
MALLSLITPDFGLFFWQTVIFLVTLYLLSKFAWGPIMSAMKEREDSITDALSAADKARADIEKLQATNEALLAEARIERDKILADAHKAATTMMEDAKVKASTEGNRLMEAARVSIQTEKNAALHEVKNYAATLAVEIAEKILRKELNNAEEQKKLVSEYIKEVNLN